MTYLENHPELVPRLADYFQFRATSADELAAQMRTEDEAVNDLRALSTQEIQRYGTQSLDHHQSSKVMVQTVDVLTRIEAVRIGLPANTNPQARVVLLGGRFIWVSPRRLDGAIPDLLNPVGIWEIKEYWGGGNRPGGSKMSDAIYEAQLVGIELRAFEKLHQQPPVRHCLLLDGRNQWLARMSDLRRAVDLLSMGLVDRIIAGREVLVAWPLEARAMFIAAGSRG